MNLLCIFISQRKTTTINYSTDHFGLNKLDIIIENEAILIKLSVKIGWYPNFFLITINPIMCFVNLLFM